MLGIILAGGNATRLQPAAQVFSKHLMPVYDKPAIYYSISNLIEKKIRNVAIVVKPSDLNLFESLIGDGSQFGIKISYCIQSSPDGVPQAFKIAQKYIGTDRVMLVLGDNIFLKMLPFSGNDLLDQSTARIFGYRVKDPSSYGVAEIGKNGEISSLVEKPVSPKSNLAIVGMYEFPPDVCEFVDMLRPSSRGELEIIDLLNLYNEKKRVELKELNKESQWFDIGTPDGLLTASACVCKLQATSKTLVGSPEIAAVKNGLVSANQMIKHMEKTSGTPYSNAIIKFLKR